MDNGLASVAEVLPHRGAMLLLDTIDAYDDQSIHAGVLPKSDAWYADADGNMPAWIGIELMAQAVAAWVGLVAKKAGLPVKQGVLLGTRSYTAEQAFFQKGEMLEVKAVQIYRDESGMGSFACEIRQKTAQTVLASATINVFEPENFEVFLKRRQKGTAA